jgi:Ras family
LTATKADLRENSRKTLITTDEGSDLAERIYANRFIECSAKENFHIKDVIHEALRASVNGPPVVEEQETSTQFSIFQCCQS